MKFLVPTIMLVIGLIAIGLYAAFIIHISRREKAAAERHKRVAALESPDPHQQEDIQWLYANGVSREEIQLIMAERERLGYK